MPRARGTARTLGGTLLVLGIAVSLVGFAGIWRSIRPPAPSCVGADCPPPEETTALPFHVVRVRPILVGDASARAARGRVAGVERGSAGPSAPSVQREERPVIVDAAGDFVRIPAIEVAVPLVRAASMEEDAILSALREGVVLYPNGIAPGQTGRIAIAGHSTGSLLLQGAYRFAFLRARHLDPGEEIHVDAGGTRYTYRVTGQRTVDPRTVPTLESTADSPRLALITCWPLWSVRQRLIVDSELASVAPLTVRTTSS